jgi:hypothetical protein
MVLRIFGPAGFQTGRANCWSMRNFALPAGQIFPVATACQYMRRDSTPEQTVASLKRTIR